MNKADVDFIKQAFKNGKVEERGVHLRETSMAVESCQQPPTGDNTPKTQPEGEIKSAYPCGEHMIHCTQHNCDNCDDNPINKRTPI